LVATQRWAENGRRSQLFKRLLELYSRKSAVGGGSAKAIGKILSTHPNLSKEEALNLRRRQIVKELCEVFWHNPATKPAGFPLRLPGVRLCATLGRRHTPTQGIATHRRDRVRH
jgi:hypothetical protein